MYKSICDASQSVCRFVSQLQPDIPQIIFYSGLKLIFWNKPVLVYPQLLLFYRTQEVGGKTALSELNRKILFHASICVFTVKAARWHS
jgi:hypothetical protein